MTMTLPAFEYLAPESIAEATRLLAENGGRAAVVGGGTDLMPKMKRRQTAPTRLISLAGVPGLSEIRIEGENCIIGASTLLSDLAASDLVPRVVATTAGAIASPQIRNTATVGGNLCLDTRCNYIDMSQSWRQASGYCMKDGGEMCWVAPRGDRCWAVSSSDLAPVAIALGGLVHLAGERGNRIIPATDLYQNDGIAFQTKSADEIVLELILPTAPLRASYRKLRRRGSIDFPILGVAAAASFDEEGICGDIRLVLGAVASAPLRALEAEQWLIGKRFSPESIEEAARLAAHLVRPQDNADLGSRYRKWMASVYVTRALSDLGEDTG